VSVEDLAGRLAALCAPGRTALVAIDGGGGSGKSSLAKHLEARLIAADVEVSIVEVDDFFLPSRHRSRGTPSEKAIGSDVDWLRLREQVLKPLRHGQPARYGRYDWTSDEVTEEREVLPGGIVIVEGIYSSRRELADSYNFRVWVECPRDLRLSRGLARDGEAARRRWEDDWMPSEDRYIREHRPQDYADAIVKGAAV
jgi:uridine kinase